MIEFMKALSTAASGMGAQAKRLRVVSENIANADTNGYKRKVVTFRNVVDDASGAREVKIGKLLFDDAPMRRVYEPGHPLADDAGRVTYSNVNLITEVADAREAQRSFEANLNVFDQTRRMYANVLDLLRR